MPDGTADAVTVFQAWHWFDAEVAVLECARVLRTGGWLSMAWHHRDDRSGWGAELSAIVRHAENIPEREDPPQATSFDAVETAEFGYLMRQSVDDLVRHAATWSFVAIHPERERMLEQVRELGVRAAGPGGMVEIPCRPAATGFGAAEQPGQPSLTRSRAMSMIGEEWVSAPTLR